MFADLPLRRIIKTVVKSSHPVVELLNITIWTKGRRQIDEIKQNSFLYGMVYS